MPEANRDLLARAEIRHPQDSRVADCWGFVTKGNELGWLDVGDLRELAEYLNEHRDWGVEELHFANPGDELRVSLLDDEAMCDGPLMANEINALLASMPNLAA